MIGPGRKRILVGNSPAPNRTYQEERSPTKASILLKTDCSQYINGLKAKKQNYSTAIGLYTACYDHQLPQKCLKHLNFVTLYCIDEHKLLCVNCLYGSTTHKTHSVKPSNSELPDIKRDNEAGIRALDDSIKQIRESEAKIYENKKIIESESSYILQEITKQFNQMRKMIDLKQKQLKERAVRQFEKAALENEITRKQVTWWREEMQKIRNGLPREGNTEEAEIYKHLVLQLMLNERLEADKITYVASKDEMEHEFLNEARELKDTVKFKIEEGHQTNKLKLF